MSAATVTVLDREYERSAGGRWSFQPRNGHPRKEIHRTSRLHHALNALLDARAELATLTTPTDA